MKTGPSQRIPSHCLVTKAGKRFKNGKPFLRVRLTSAASSVSGEATVLSLPFPSRKDSGESPSPFSRLLRIIFSLHRRALVHAVEACSNASPSSARRRSRRRNESNRTSKRLL